MAFSDIQLSLSFYGLQFSVVPFLSISGCRGFHSVTISLTITAKLQLVYGSMPQNEPPGDVHLKRHNASMHPSFSVDPSFPNPPLCETTPFFLLLHLHFHFLGRGFQYLLPWKPNLIQLQDSRTMSRNRIDTWRKDVTQPPSSREPKAQPPQQSDESSSLSESEELPDQKHKSLVRPKGDLDKKPEATVPSSIDRWRKGVIHPPKACAQPTQELSDDDSSQSDEGPDRDLDRHCETKHEAKISRIDRWRKDVTQQPGSVECKAQPPHRPSDEESSQSANDEASTSSTTESPKEKSFTRTKGHLDRDYEKKQEATAPSSIDRWRKDLAASPKGPQQHPSAVSSGSKPRSLIRVKGELDDHYGMKHAKEEKSLIEGWRGGVTLPPQMAPVKTIQNSKSASDANPIPAPIRDEVGRVRSHSDQQRQRVVATKPSARPARFLRTRSYTSPSQHHPTAQTYASSCSQGFTSLASEPSHQQHPGVENSDTNTSPS